MDPYTQIEALCFLQASGLKTEAGVNDDRWQGAHVLLLGFV